MHRIKSVAAFCVLAGMAISYGAQAQSHPPAPSSPFDYYKSPQQSPSKSDDATSSATNPAETLARLLNEGSAARRKSDFQTAIKLFTTAIEAAPTASAPYTERGLAHLGAKSYDAALADFDKALEVAGEKASKATLTLILINRSIVLQQQNKLDRALADLDRAISIDGDSAAAFANRGLLHVVRKSPDKALTDVERAIQLKPDYDFAHYVRGTALVETKQFDRAAGDFLKVLEATPGHRGAIFGLKRADLRGGEQEGEGTVAHVRSSDAACEPTCAEWISVQGRIVSGMAEQLKATIKALNGRKLPVFVDSGGGAVSEAMDMGRAIRAAGLDVAVTRTMAVACTKNDESCRKRLIGVKMIGTPRGEASVCASSCGFLLAAGQRRAIGRSSLVGVHQVASYQTYQEVYRRYEVRREMRDGKMVEVSRKLISEERGEKKTVQTKTEDTTYARVRTYYTEMGTDASIMSLLVSAPHKGMYWLNADDLARTNTRTDLGDGRVLLSSSVQVGAPSRSGEPAKQPTAPAVYTLSSDGDIELIKAIQVQLNRIGCSPGNDSGKWGNGLRRAIERFNTLTGKSLDLTGPNGDTLDALTMQKGRVCPV